ncbi:hypothetical protein AAG570_013995 [Ranatra chinensis]|uniref:Elongator complex protein 6 n=1 Tax=Ranatra chinensis TaxID=642074 RepID=A0ABD0YFP4_9HEMI
MSSFCLPLELDKEDFSAKVVVIVEEDSSNSNFALASLLWKAVNTNDSGILLLALHYPAHHYGHVANKLGFKLIPLVDSGRLIGLDPKKQIFDLLVKNNVGAKDLMNDLKPLYLSISEGLQKLKQSHKSVFIFIDDISDLINAGASLSSVIAFTHYLRALVSPGITLIMGTHCNENDQEQLQLKNRLILGADIILTVAGLKTGISADVTGSIELIKKCCDSLRQFTKDRLFHYKATDRTIRIFSPGTLI